MDDTPRLLCLPYVLPPVVTEFGSIKGRDDPWLACYRGAGHDVAEPPWHDHDQVEYGAGCRGHLKSEAADSFLRQQVPALQLYTHSDVECADTLSCEKNIGKCLGLPDEPVSGPLLIWVPLVPHLVEGPDDLALNARSEHGVEREKVRGIDSLKVRAELEEAGQHHERGTHALY